ncbi:MAG: ATP-dependent helicase [Deltaproteobacteria bacterium]|jgi:DNA helicase-2/ATP-dependent DNA helicase PcrA|nr:ATP-dependent helicase [Deltaproteobacteria bacterium]
MIQLSIEQKQIVEHIDGALLVKAGPGSGKTRVLTERVKMLLTKKKRGKVLALTFSNMAADEMRLRLEMDTELSDSLKRAHVSTIHSFCLDLVQSRGYLIGLRPEVSLLEKEDDRRGLLRDLFINEPTLLEISNNQKKSNDFISECLATISEQKRKLISPQDSDIEEPFPSIYKKYNDLLAAQNSMDYDDILFFTYRILMENFNLAQLYTTEYRYICIDEAQDLNKAQYRVIQALCRNTFNNIMMVGDDYQSIYAFIGSSSKYMTDFFVQDFSPTIYTLDENFRSAENIMQFANTLVGITNDISHYHYKGYLEINGFENEIEEAKDIISKIRYLIHNKQDEIEGELTYDKIAIIARNKYVFSNIESELQGARIPFYYRKNTSGIFFETDFMKAFDFILRLIINPFDLYHKRLLCKLTGKKTIEPKINENILETINDLLSNSAFEWLSECIKGIEPETKLNFDNVINILNDYIPNSLPDDDRYLLQQDIFELATHWKHYKHRVPSENRTLVSFRHAIALGKTQKNETNEGVALLTAHMSKGLEFEVVFIIGLSDGTFPDYRAIRSGEEAIVQEKNNLYVAVTRAKRQCYLSYPKFKQMPWGDCKWQEPSRFIKLLES